MPVTNSQPDSQANWLPQALLGRSRDAARASVQPHMLVWHQAEAAANEDETTWGGPGIARGEAARIAARYRLIGMMADEGECPISSGEGLSDHETSSGGEEDEDCELEAAEGSLAQRQLQRIHMLQAQLGERTQQLQQQLSTQEPLQPHAPLPGPFPCSYLSQGQSFIGSQRLSNAPVGASEDWQVVVRIDGLDLAKGSVCGVMEAVNVPHARSPIITFWEGEIVDNSNFTFITGKWGATRDTDMRHWSKFPGFHELESQVSRSGGRAAGLATTPYVFMRWKEMNFVNTSEACGLTIAGFYFVCLDRQDGSVQGYYYDPSSAPFQFLQLNPLQSPGGLSFGSYAMA